MAKLTLRAADGSTREVSLDDHGSLTIGRSPECEFHLDEVQASRRHCTVVRLQSGFEVADLGSTNGTLVNGQLTKRKKLEHGDVIRIGQSEITFVDESAARSSGAESKTCSLVWTKGEKKGQVIELSLPRTTFGRKETNTVVLHDTVASSYHCEIIRNLNGYTVRDLGSTNGTMVNGETVTEAQLSHGSKLRIGNSRFVFQDPAMAAIDLELAAVEEEAPEWGMMRDLDLAAVRRRNPATFVYLGLFLAILGGAGYLLTLEKKPGAGGGPVAPAGNLLEDYSFETRKAEYAWESEPGDAAEVRLTGAKASSGRSGLEVRAKQPASEVWYDTSLDGRDKRYRITGKVATQGASAELGIRWSGFGLDRWSAGAPVSASSFQGVDLVASAPAWARTARVGVKIRGQGAVWLDDVALVEQGKPDVAEIKLGSFTLSITDGSRADLSYAGTPILANGAALPAGAPGLSLSASLADEAHILLTVKGAGDRPGFRMEEVGGYLGKGFRAFGLRDDGTSFFESAPPEKPLGGVRKLLLGPRGEEAIAVLGATDEERFTTETAREGGAIAWSVTGEPKDGAFSLRLKCDLHGETKQASERIDAAQQLLQAGRLGDFLVEAPRVLAEYPFASEELRRRLSEAVASARQGYEALLGEADDQLRDYAAFRDLQSLERVRQILAELRSKYQVTPEDPLRGPRYLQLAQAEETARLKSAERSQAELAASLLAQVRDFHLPAEEICSAAVLLHYIVSELPASTEVAEAKAELEKIRKTHPHVIEVLERGSRG